MNKRRKKCYRKILIIALFFNILAIPLTYLWVINGRIPNEIVMFAGEEGNFSFNTPVVGVFSGKNKENTHAISFDFAKPVTLKMQDTGTYQMKLELFGLLHLKDMQVNVMETKTVIPGGENIGIYVETKGVMVLGNGSVTGIDGMKYEPAQNRIKTGDYIVAVNGTAVNNIEEMIKEVDNSAATEIVLDVIRNNEQQKISVTPVETNPGQYKLGIWVRDDTQGVGTLTYRTAEGDFGALGHGITDGDTGLLMEIDKGSLFDTEIIDIVKGENGKPGEVVGIIRSSEAMKLGEINKNTECGIFGKTKTESKLWNKKEEVGIGLKQEVKKGKASILCQLDGNVDEYDIEIEKIKWNSNTDSKGMIIKITDERLLKKTNGIIQGMSGSPILQNGKIIGAVTHVFVQDSSKGYGIFIENMLKK